MNLDIIEKHVHLTPLANGNIEVMFSGQPCLGVNESYDGGYSWKINPLFAKLTYGANIFEDVPYCGSSLDSVEEAIAEGLSSLNDLGAFHGVVDLPTDTYVEDHLDEAIGELDEAEERLVERADSKAAKPACKTPEQEKTEWDKLVKECIIDDCRKEALKHSDSIMEAHDLAQGLLDSVMDELNEGEWADSLKARASTLVKKLTAPVISNKEVADYVDAHQTLKKIHTDPKFKEKFKKDPASAKKDIWNESAEDLDEATHSGTFKDGDVVSVDYHDISGKSHHGKANVDKSSKAYIYVRHPSMTDHTLKFHQTVNNKNTANEVGALPGTKAGGYRITKLSESLDLDEAALSGDAYWKAKEEAAKEAKAKEERASMGIKEPVKKGRGKPTNIDLEFVHAAAKKNVEAGKRPTAGMERNEKIHFVRHLAKHPDFAEKHVAAAGRPTGTTKAAKAEKEVEKKKETSAFSMWAGLGKK